MWAISPMDDGFEKVMCWKPAMPKTNIRDNFSKEEHLFIYVSDCLQLFVKK